MSFIGNGEGNNGDEYQVTSVAEWNDIKASGLTGDQYILMNDIDATGETLTSVTNDGKVVKGNGKKLLNIDAITDKRLFDGIISDIELNFNLSKSIDGSLTPFGLFTEFNRVKITGSITNTHANGVVEGLANRIINNSSDAIVTANLSAHKEIYGLSSGSTNDGGKRLIFAGTMTDLSGSATLVGTQGVFGALEDVATSLFWDIQTSGTSNSYDQNAGGKTTTELQTLSTYLSLYTETYYSSNSVDIAGTTVNVLGNQDPFTPLSAGDPLYVNGVEYEIASITADRELELTTPPPTTYIDIVGEELGTGDGTTVEFSTGRPWAIESGSVTVYLNGDITTDYSLSSLNRVVTFNTAPANGVAITIDYTWRNWAQVISSGTGTYRLTEVFDMVDISNFDGSQTWTIQDGTSYPELGVFSEVVSVPSATVTFNSVAEPNTNVILLQSDNKNWLNPVIVDQGVTDSNGDYTYTTEAYDQSKVHTFITHKPDPVDPTLAKSAVRMAEQNVV